jgi:hypothetical protein
MATTEIRAGDPAVIEVVLTRRDGTLQPLTGAETGSFVFSTWPGADVLTVALAVSDAPNSKVKATLTGVQTLALKGQMLHVRVPVTLAGGVETFPTVPEDLSAFFYY